MRLSLSNLFREFKSTSTWLQFPFSLLKTEAEPRDAVAVQGEKTRKKNDKHTPKFSEKHRWTLLVLDLRAILTENLNVKFAYVKNIQLCANIAVKGVFTSHSEYTPLVSDSDGSTGIHPLPCEMRLPLGKTEAFTEVYDYVRFPFVRDGVQRHVEGLRKRQSTNRPSVLEVQSVNGVGVSSVNGGGVSSVNGGGVSSVNGGGVESVNGEGVESEEPVRRWRVEREQRGVRVSPSCTMYIHVHVHV